MKTRVLRFDILGSTNTEAAVHARHGADEGLCIVADEQTHGKGRQGRSWASKKGAGVYLSLILRPALEPKYLSLLTLAAAVAVYDHLLRGFRIQPDIKWPNDVLVDGKKICGILAEAIETDLGLAIILGIGLNIETPEQRDSTSIKAQSPFPAVGEEIVETLLEDIGKIYNQLQDRPSSIVEMWKARSSYWKGMPVEVVLAKESFTGTTDGLEETGALRVKLSDGSVTIVHAGDVTRLRSH